MGLFSSRQRTDVDVAVSNENIFSPNVITNVAVNGLENLGALFRSGLDAIAGGNAQQTASIDQGALNVASAINGAGLNVSNGILGASENLGDSVTSAGVNIATGVVISAAVVTVGRAVLSGK